MVFLRARQVEGPDLVEADKGEGKFDGLKQVKGQEEAGN